MKAGYSIIIIIALGISFSCRTRNEVVVKNNCEDKNDWINSDDVRFGDARSGKFYCYTGDKSNFSTTFVKKISKISSANIISVEMSVWFKIADIKANAAYVLSIESDDTPVFYETVSTQQELPSLNTWTRLYNRISIPPGLNPEYVLKIYTLNQSGLEVDFDDFEIHFNHE